MNYWYHKFLKFNPESYINYPFEEYIKAYKYEGNIYTISDLYEVLKLKCRVEVEKRTFIKWDKTKAVKDWYVWEVNIVYLAALRMNNGRAYYISTDGVFYNGNYEEVNWSAPRYDEVKIIDDGEELTLRAGYHVIRKFIDKEYYQDNGYVGLGNFDFSNNRIDNIKPYTPK